MSTFIRNDSTVVRELSKILPLPQETTRPRRDVTAAGAPRRRINSCHQLASHCNQQQTFYACGNLIQMAIVVSLKETKAQRPDKKFTRHKDKGKNDQLKPCVLFVSFGDNGARVDTERCCFTLEKIFYMD
jgi:hypothetical protein